MTNQSNVSWLPRTPQIEQRILEAVTRDYARFASGALPKRLDEYLAEHYQFDLTSEYAGCPIANPWGKASGQLSMTAHQVAEDVEAGLGFVVLKTVIAEDDSGAQSMKDWAVPESRMVAERIIGKSGQAGWTIDWKGRGWWQPFDTYLQLVREARAIAASTGTLIVPSCKYHLPTPDETDWKVAEYEHTTRLLLEAWHGAVPDSSTGVHSPTASPMPLEKDFSPTLAGSNRAALQEQILEWLRTVPRLVKQAAQKTFGATDNSAMPDDTVMPSIRLGLKIFNALFDDVFQLEMLRCIHQPGSERPDFYIYGNRLFDPDRAFDGHQGIAYGGPDLSDRNLRVTGRFFEKKRSGDIAEPGLQWSATGNIVTGKTALEYALRGASSFQLHTFFQLPTEVYSKNSGSKIQKALHELYFHPTTGFIVWMHHLAGVFGLDQTEIKFRDVIGKGRPPAG